MVSGTGQQTEVNRQFLWFCNRHANRGEQRATAALLCGFRNRPVKQRRLKTSVQRSQFKLMTSDQLVYFVFNFLISHQNAQYNMHKSLNIPTVIFLTTKLQFCFSHLLQNYVQARWITTLNFAIWHPRA